MIAVDVKNPIEVRAAGLRALNKELGADVARVFIKQYFGGRGDLTKEKYDEPDWTPEEFDAMLEIAKTESIAAGVWES